jgi:glyoxylate reductase
MPTVAVTRPNLPGHKIQEMASRSDVAVWASDAPPTVDELAELIGDARAILCVNGDPIAGELLDRCPEVRLVAIASVGYDTVDVAEAAQRGVAVTNAPGVIEEATADAAFALILAARRRIVEADRYVHAGSWERNSLTLMVGHDIHGAKLGIVGYGTIGRAVARRATGFGMRISHYSRTRRDDELSSWAPLDDLLAESDVVSLHPPLTEQTRGLIGARELGLMKPTATLVNTARGAVVDEAALIDALRERRIHSAGLDVQVLEPNPDPDHPLHQLDNCVVLPHICSATYASRAAMFDLAAANVMAFLAGEALVSPVPTTT